MVSWSMLTVHIAPAIALQLMRGVYNGQERPLISKKTPNHTSKLSEFYFPELLTIWFGFHNPDQVYFCIFAAGARTEEGGKSNSLRGSLREIRLRAHLFILRKEVMRERERERERGRRGEFKRNEDLAWGKAQEGD